MLYKALRWVGAAYGQMAYDKNPPVGNVGIVVVVSVTEVNRCCGWFHLGARSIVVAAGATLVPELRQS